MRGVLGLALVIVGFSLAILIVLGKFPPQAGAGNAPGSGIEAVIQAAQKATGTTGGGGGANKPKIQ